MTAFFANLTVYQDLGLLALRLAVGLVFIVHGLPKIKNPQPMAAGMGWPAGAIILLGLVESLSGLAQIMGILIQPTSLLLALVMIGASYMKIVKWKTPFSAHDKMGWEFDLTLFAAALLILVTGGGRFGL